MSGHAWSVLLAPTPCPLRVLCLPLTRPRVARVVPRHRFPSCLRQVFEIDQALVLRVKNALLSNALAENGLREICDGVDQTRVIAVEADLSQAGWEDALVEAGFDPSQPSAWILEGLTM